MTQNVVKLDDKIKAFNDRMKDKKPQAVKQEPVRDVQIKETTALKEGGVSGY